MSEYSALSDKELLAQCESIRQRRSGPGGQHRNKVETAIRLKHLPTGLTGQASERRSQQQNLQQALQRLRLELALNIRKERSASELQAPISPSALWQSRIYGEKIKVNPDHQDFVPLLSEALDHLAWADWDHKQAADSLKITGSQLLKFLKTEPAAWQLLNSKRQQLGEKPLR